jgi:hypothetical protein
MMASTMLCVSVAVFEAQALQRDCCFFVWSRQHMGRTTHAHTLALDTFTDTTLMAALLSK